MMKFLLTVGGAYALLVLIVYLLQGSLLYLPSRQLSAGPEDIGLGYDDVSLHTSDGVRIHGWFVPAESNRTLLFFHGNAGNISHRLHSIQQFHELGVSVFIVDYRGYGQSAGNPSEEGLHRDAEAAWHYLTETRGIAGENIIVFGRSLGGSVAAWLAKERSPGALIVDSTFTSVPDIGADVYPWLPVRLLSKFQHATLEHLQATKAPVLVVHSRDDEIIPFQHGEALFNAANEPKTFLEIRGGHNDAHLTSEAAYLNGVHAFLETTNASDR